MPQCYLVTDFETRSEADLRKVGSSEYSLHTSTRVLCVAWRYGTKEELPTAKTKSWSPAYPSDYGEFINALLNPEVILIGHNVLFEQFIIRNVLSRILSSRPGLRSIPVSRFLCSASLAAALALPRSLEGAAKAIGLKAQKDLIGHKLMMKMSKPRRSTKNDSRKWHNSSSDLKRLIQYCKQDVDTTVELFLKLPDLCPQERKIWELDQKINHRGFLIDRELVKTVLFMIEKELKELDTKTQEITNGEIRSVGQRDATLSWLNKRGFNLPDLKADTVLEILKSESIKTSEGGRLLEIRQAVSKTSTAKYTTFENLSRTDGRCRDSLLYHGASTGRWTGKNVQVQNFPRGNIKDTDYACQILKDCDLEMVRLIYGNPMEVFSSCLRGMIIPTPGKELFCADYNAIETRVLFWIANHEEGLNAYRETRDLYREMASSVYRKDFELVTESERDVGKKIILGAGYGLGWKKFLKVCEQSGIEMDERLAELAINAYRSTHHPVPTLWKLFDKAAVYATENRKKVLINHTKWFVENDFLYCELPSGRRLAYYKPEVRYELTPWGEKAPKLYHYGINPVSKQWELSGTYGGKLVENVVQGVARDFLAAAMIRLEDAGYQVLLTCHDEAVSEKENGSLKEYLDLMTVVPQWGEGCPITAEGWKGLRYRK
jgi:DNA polymerase